MRLGLLRAALLLFAPLCAAPLLLSPMDSAYSRLMAPAGFRPDDFNLLVNYRAEIPRTLPAVESLLRRPASVDSLIPALRNSLKSDNFDHVDFSLSLWPWLKVQPYNIVYFAEPSSEDWARQTDQYLQEYLKPLTSGEVNYLRTEVPPMLVFSIEDTSLNPIESETQRLRGDAILDSVMRITGKLPSEKLANASHTLEQLRAQIHRVIHQRGAPAALEVLKKLRKNGVPVELGSNGPNVHRLDRGIVFDPDGDDRYEFAETTRPGSWLLVIDLAGNDEYHADDSVGGAAAFLSVQIIEDQSGNDKYLGRELAFGSAVMGYSHLIDGAGDDTYEARCASLGYAFHGIGILEDRNGNDTYSTAYFSQGAASTNGIGLLLDDAGDDHYVTLPVFPDDLRYRDHFLSMSQGFSSGFAPRYAGGIGVLWDRAGADTYLADIFGQGTGYWFAWGLLMDDAGNDTLRAYQYAQGAGVHFAVGTLRDGEGDDVRVSKGVSQGCGHDGGFGMLTDFQGNDSTAAVDMSAGAGSANGLGTYLDFSGADTYSMGNPRMTLGHGDMRRDRGSLGFFLDLGGKDAYPVLAPSVKSGAKDEAAWRVYDSKSRGYGYGLDAR